jgi:hypothetical protein
MERIKSILYSDKNVKMLQSICIKKIKNEATREHFDFIKTRFEDLFLSVMTTIFEEEIYNYLEFPLKTSILKINSIVIKEACNYILSVAEENTEDMTTYIEDIPEEFTDTVEKEPVLDEPDRPIEPQFIEELYEIGSKNTYKEGNEYISDIYLPNIKSLEMLQVKIDRSDYIITEYCNKFKINNTMIEISPGNYEETQLESIIQGIIDTKINSDKNYLMTIIINFEKTNDCYLFSCTNIDSKDIKTTIDFSIENSIAEVIGFDKVVYTLKTAEPICGNKHKLCYPTLALFNIEFTDDVKSQVIVPLNVKYNETKFYDLEYKKLYTSIEPLFTVSQVKITIENERGEPYNTRNRDFYIRFKTLSLLN